MSHITCQKERDENQAIWDCPDRKVGRWTMVYNEYTGESEEEWVTESKCDVSERVSVAKDRCKRCGKIFTY